MIRLRSGSCAICETFPPVCSSCSSPTQRSRGHIQHFWRAGCCSHKGTGQAQRWLTAGSGPSAHPQYLKRFWCSVALGAHDTQKLPQENTSAESWTNAWREVPEGLQEAAAESTWGQGDTEGLRGAQSSSGLQRCHVFTCHSPNIHHTTLNISVPAAELEQSQLPKSLASAGWLCLGICTQTASCAAPQSSACLPHPQWHLTGVSSAGLLLLQQLCAVHSKFL